MTASLLDVQSLPRRWTLRIRNKQARGYWIRLRLLDRSFAQTNGHVQGFDRWGMWYDESVDPTESNLYAWQHSRSSSSSDTFWHQHRLNCLWIGWSSSIIDPSIVCKCCSSARNEVEHLRFRMEATTWSINSCKTIIDHWWHPIPFIWTVSYRVYASTTRPSVSRVRRSSRCQSSTREIFSI